MNTWQLRFVQFIRQSPLARLKLNLKRDISVTREIDQLSSKNHLAKLDRALTWAERNKPKANFNELVKDIEHS